MEAVMRDFLLGLSLAAETPKRRQTHELLAPPVTLLHRGRRGCRGRGGREAKGEVLLAIFCHGGIASSINTPLNSIRPFAKNWVYGGNNWLLTLRIGTTVCKNVETPIPSGLRGRLTIVICEHICVYMWEGFSGFIGLRFACFLFGKSCVGLSEKGLVKWQIFAPKMKFSIPCRRLDFYSPWPQLANGWKHAKKPEILSIRKTRKPFWRETLIWWPSIV